MKADPILPDAPAKTSWRGALRGNVLAMGLVSLFTDFSSEMMNPLLPIFIALLVGGARAAVFVGLMEGIAETTASILKIFSGRISDKTGKRKALVILGYGASSISRPMMALAGLVSFATAGFQVVFLKFLDRIGKGIRTSPRDALIGDSVPKEFRGLAFSFHRAMDHMGAVLGPIVSIVILYFLLGPPLWESPAIVVGDQPTVGAFNALEISDLRWLFALAVIPGMAAMASAIFMVREIPPAQSSHQSGSDPAAQPLPKKFYAFVSIVTVFALGNSSDLFIVLLAATKFKMSLLFLMFLWIAFHLSKIVFSIPGGVLSDKFGRRPLIVAGWIVYALVYLGLAFADPDAQWQFWALILAYGFYYGLSEGAEKALVADFVPSQRRGTAFGIYHGAIGLAALPASLIFGLLWTQMDKLAPGMGSKVAFSIGAALAALAALALTILLARSPKDAAKPTPAA